MQLPNVKSRRLLSNDQTWITNESSHDLVATTSYVCFSYCDTKSKFIDRTIKSGDKDHDQYCQQSQVETTVMPLAIGENGGQAEETEPVGCGVPRIGITIGFSGAHDTGYFEVFADTSIFAKDSPVSAGIDIFKATHGSLVQADGAALGQIYNN